MEILNFKDPFPHTLIYDFYDEVEQKLIWEELEFLNKPGKLCSPEETGDPLASKNKKSIFLDNLYNYRQVSNILNVNRKIFNILDKIEDSVISKYLNIADTDHTMINYYEDGAYYAPHHDIYVISSITTFWKTPKKFSGGNLTFTEFDYTPKMDYNSMVIFPSFVIHGVTPVELNNNDGINGRYTINQFYSIRQRSS